MSIERLYVIGAGGHAKVVLDALSRAKCPANAVEVIDDDPQKCGRCILAERISPWPSANDLNGASFHLAVGEISTRIHLHKRTTGQGARELSVFHPTASMASSAVIGDGCFVAAHAVIAPGARIAPNTIINHGAVVDHDCIIGDFSHVAPNATLGGGVEIGAKVLIGAGATILPGVRIGEGAVIAAGGTIVHDVLAGEVVIFEQVRKMKDLK